MQVLIKPSLPFQVSSRRGLAHQASVWISHLAYARSCITSGPPPVSCKTLFHFLGLNGCFLRSQWSWGCFYTFHYPGCSGMQLLRGSACLLIKEFAEREKQRKGRKPGQRRPGFQELQSYWLHLVHSSRLVVEELLPWQHDVNGPGAGRLSSGCFFICYHQWDLLEWNFRTLCSEIKKNQQGGVGRRCLLLARCSLVGLVTISSPPWMGLHHQGLNLCRIRNNTMGSRPCKGP